MNNNESVQFYIRFVNERYRKVVSTTNDLVKCLSGENAGEKKAKTIAVKNSTGDLLAALSENDKPNWLLGLNQRADLYATDRLQNYQLMQFLFDNRLQILNHTWAFEGKDDAFDFDSIFEHYRAESRLPELFDEIVKILESIQNSGEVDSVAMMTALGKVIATLKGSKDGSYFSVNSAWSFLVSFLQNYMWAELSKLPVLGTAMEALRETIEQTNEEMFKVHCAVENEMKQTVEAQIKGLERSDFKFVGYDKSGKSLESVSKAKGLSAQV